MIVSNVCSYIRENMDHNLTLDDLADYFGYSKYHFSRKFKQETGYTYKQYIEALKIEKSIAALLGGNGTITDAFLDSQHESSGTFSNTFKKLTGLSPNLFRRDIASLCSTLIYAIKSKGNIVYRKREVTKGGRISVNLEYPRCHDERVSFVGLFENGIPNRAPIIGVALYKQTCCVLDFIPEGKYHLMVTEIDLTSEITNYFLLKMNYRAKVEQPIVITKETDTHYNLMMRLSIPEDPPILVNLPLLVKQALLKSHK